MFESEDWIIEDAFNEGDVEEETRGRSQCSLCENEEKTVCVKRRKMDDSCKILSSLSTDITFFRQSELDTTMIVEDNDPSFKNVSNVSRGDLLLGIFHKNTSRETFNLAKEEENDLSGVRKTEYFRSKVDATSKIFQYEESKDHKENSHKSMTKVRFTKQIKKLIRIFPGPAGLVPDMKNDNNISAASYLSSVEELERTATPSRTKCIEIKSQDEKNLIGEKAWKLLSNDLPKNFLQNYKISAIKDKANASHCDNTKVKFIAGVLDYIDHSYDDPFVILKDATDSIEGTIHRDVPLTYPGILEPNVVILLCDVGLLKTTTYIVTNKYHILVSLVNLLAIYSDKGRIVSTSIMENILSHTGVELNRNNDRMPLMKSIYMSGLQKTDKGHNALQISSSIESSSPNVKARKPDLPNDPLLHPLSKKYESYGETSENDKNYKVTDKTLGHFNYFNYSMDMNDSDRTDISFTTNYDFTVLEEQTCFDRSLCKTISQTNKIQRRNLQIENTKHLKNIKEGWAINLQKQTKEPQILQKCTDKKTRRTRYSHENCFLSYNNTSYGDSNVTTVKSTLSKVHNVENSKTLLGYFNDNDSEYDSDDEILSQLDIDNVFDESKTVKEKC